MTLATALESLAANLPATLVALGGLLVSIGTLYKSIQNGKKADEAAAVAVVAVRRADAVAAETSTIKTNTDGSLSEQRHKIELLEQSRSRTSKLRGSWLLTALR